MPANKVYNMQGEVIGEVALSDAVFGIEPNIGAIHAVVKNHLANMRQGTQSTLTRAEVSGRCQTLPSKGDRQSTSGVKKRPALYAWWCRVCTKAAQLPLLIEQKT